MNGYCDFYLLLTDFAEWPGVLTEKMTEGKKQLYPWLKAKKGKLVRQLCAQMPAPSSSGLGRRVSNLVKSVSTLS